MRKIIVGAQISLDGVMQAPGGPDEDPTGGFKFGGWGMTFFDQEAGEEIDRLFAEKFDLLLGRKTYEIFAAFWPFFEAGPPDDSIAKLFDRITKYPVSRSGEIDTSWQGTTLLRSLDDVRRLREGDGPDLVTQGSTELVHALLAADLVDEISLITMPVVLGGGKKLWAEGAAPHAFKLTHSRVTSNGIVVSQYARAGGVEVGAAPGIEKPTALELKRRARMKREG